VSWVGVESPYSPCNMDIRVEYEIGCKKKQVIAVGTAPLSSDAVWANQVDVVEVFPDIQQSVNLSRRLVSTTVHNFGVISFNGLEFNGYRIPVTLRSSSHVASVSFAVPGNTISDPATHGIAYVVWQQLVGKVLDADIAKQCLQ